MLSPEPEAPPSPPPTSSHCSLFSDISQPRVLLLNRGGGWRTTRVPQVLLSRAALPALEEPSLRGKGNPIIANGAPAGLAGSDPIPLFC